VQLLGQLSIFRSGIQASIPPSRKVRALLTYLVLSPRPVTREHLCELLWDVPNDPKGELRWCLSKIRHLIDEPDRPRVRAQGEAVRLELTGCLVDALEVAQAVQNGIAELSVAEARRLARLFQGDLLQGLELDRSPAFHGWLTAQRRRFHSYQTALLEHIVSNAPVGEGDEDLEQWLAVAPFDHRAHQYLFHVLARRGQMREAEQHLAAASRLFQAEELDCTLLHEAWRSAKQAQSRTAATSGLAASSEPVRMADVPIEVAKPSARRASIAVMPFVDQSASGSGRGGTADALAHDIITRLAKLRSLFVIAQGSVFALHERQLHPQEAGRVLDVDYVTGGSVRHHGNRLTVTIDLMESRTARVIWAEIFNVTLDDAFLVLAEIGDRIVASIASEIETAERNRAILRPPNSLDAWEAHHRGLWHMYRFNQTDNEHAQRFFETSVRLDPTFSRAYAGLSFTHFQNAFQGWSERRSAVSQALKTAEHSLLADERDPAAHWAMGRALWLGGRYDPCFLELEQAVELSPNFALGHYTLAFVRSQVGDPSAAISSADYSRHLSPCDPMLFGMLGARAMALVRLGRFDEAADWGVKAAARPNAHAHIQAIAAYSLALAARADEARACFAALRRLMPNYCVDDFLTAMQFAPEDAKLFHTAATKIEAGP
jgi:DNA-binding SARP family transcriptional activator/TolB-like protein